MIDIHIIGFYAKMIDDANRFQKVAREGWAAPITTLRVALDLLARRATRDLILSTLNQPLNLHQLTDCFKVSTVKRGIVW